MNEPDDLTDPCPHCHQPVSAYAGSLCPHCGLDMGEPFPKKQIGQKVQWVQELALIDRNMESILPHLLPHFAKWSKNNEQTYENYAKWVEYLNTKMKKHPNWSDWGNAVAHRAGYNGATAIEMGQVIEHGKQLICLWLYKNGGNEPKL